MQNSQLYRRGIVFPKTEEAECLLSINNIDEDTPVRYLELPYDYFSRLWDLDFFTDINKRAGVIIDDYEEDWVEPAKIHCILEAIDNIITKFDVQSEAMQLFLMDLHTLSKESHRLGRSVLFIL